MRKILFTALSILLATPLASLAEPSGSECKLPYSCGPERVLESSDKREAGKVVQDEVESPIEGLCGSPLPAKEAYGAVNKAILCGSASEEKNREPAPIPEAMLDKWTQRYTSSKGKLGLEETQEIRRMDEKLAGELPLRMVETWTWKEKVGGFNSARCGEESIDMQCYKERTEEYTDYEWREDRSNCIDWYTPPPPPRDNGGTTIVPVPVPGAGSRHDDRRNDRPITNPGGGYRSDPPPQRRDPPPVQRQPDPPARRGESKTDLGKKWDSIQTSKPQGAPSRPATAPSRPAAPSRPSAPSRPTSSGGRRAMLDMNQILNQMNEGVVREAIQSPIASRGLAQSGGYCRQYGQKQVPVKRTRSAGRVTYDCKVSRAKWCTWYETRDGERACPNQKVKYTVEYLHDPQWKPGYVSPDGDPARVFNSMIPNKFDLLPGESEKRKVFVNQGEHTMSAELRASLQIDGQACVAGGASCRSHWNEYKVEPSKPIACVPNGKDELKIQVSTIGRIKRKAPRFIRQPKEDEVPDDHPDKGLRVDKGRPVSAYFIDDAREYMLDASKISRGFGKDENAGLASGWWVDTQYKLQLFTRDKKGRLVSMTLPMKFNSNQAKYVRDSITISLTGTSSLDRFYRPSGPLEFVMKNVYHYFGTELSRDTEYFMRVEVVNRGLPFYESGCKGGKMVCEGEEATTDSYSEPLDLKFRTPKDLPRSWYRLWKDINESIMWN